jgi:hypothetical protein
MQQNRRPPVREKSLDISFIAQAFDARTTSRV